jgi:hypothetical protein
LTKEGGGYLERFDDAHTDDDKTRWRLKRELSIRGEPYTLTLSGEGFTLALKGRRKGLDIVWADLVGGDAALALR